MKRNIAIIIRGPIGVGKTTIAKLLQDKMPGSVIISVDNFKHIISPKSSTMRTKIAHKVANFFINELIKNRIDMIIEEIFRDEHYDNLIRTLRNKNYDVFSFFLTAPEEVLIKRDRNRLKNKGVNIVKKFYVSLKPNKMDFIINTSTSKKRIIMSILKNINLT